MDTVTFCGDAGIETTRLGFGTAGLLREPSRRRRLDVLAAALDAGIRHFDTAPVYGLGEAERVLGEFLATRRERVTIATKFGLAIKGSVARLGPLQSIARTFLRAVPPLRRVARRKATSLYEPPRFDAHAARTSLERSLAALRRDHVDALLLHDCQPDATRDPELLGALADLRTRGRIKTFGAATTFEHTLEMIRSRPDLCRVVQFENDALLDHVRRLPATFPATVITHSVLGRSMREIGAALRADPSLSARWSAAVDANLLDATVLASFLTRIALLANPRGIVLLHSNSARHVRANAETVRAPADREQVERLAELIRSHFAAASADAHVQAHAEQVRS